jgi:hypothetical protein
MEFLRHPPKEFVHPEWVNKYGDRIREGKRFVYDLSTYKIYPNRAELLFQKFVESDEERKSKCVVEYYPNKKKKEYIIEKSIVMVEAPKSYLQHLLKYEPIKKIKKNEGSSKLQKRRIH